MKKSTKIVAATAAVGAVAGIQYYGICKKAFNMVFKNQNKIIEEGDLFSKDELEPSMIWFNEAKVYDAWITSNDGLRLNAVRIESHPDKHLWAVLVHGYGANYLHLLDQAMEFDKHGFNVLLVNNRGFGISEGKYTTMGYKESEDVALWLEYLKEHDEMAKFVLYGISLGGTIVMLTLNKANTDDILCAIEDCGFSTLYDELNHMAKKHFKLPISVIKPTFNKMMKSKLGFVMEDVNCMQALEVNDIPVMFIHGELDDVVPYEMVFDNYYADRGAKELFTVSNAGHIQSEENPEYYNRIFRFIERFAK